MHFFSKSIVPLALLCMTMPALGQTQKWLDTTDHYVTYGLNSDDYGTYVTVGIEGTEDRLYMAYNFDIILPPGVTFPVTGATEDYVFGEVYHNLEDGFYPMVFQRPNYIPDHQLSNSIKDNGSRAKVICVSFTNQNFLKPTGRICDCYVDVHPLARPGENRVKFREMVMCCNVPGADPVQYAPHNTLYNIEWGTINIPAERTVEINISAADMWGTVILPFALGELPEGIEAFKATTVNAKDGVGIEQVTHLEAYKPYIVYAPEGWKTSLSGVASAEDFPTAAPALSPAKVPYIPPQEGYADEYPENAIASNGVLQSNIKPHDRTEGFTFAVENGTPTFKRIDSEAGTTMNIGDVFITPNEEDETLPDTLQLNRAVEVSAPQINAEKGEEVIYNLRGQKITTPTPGTLYITNGNTYIKQ